MLQQEIVEEGEQEKQRSPLVVNFPHFQEPNSKLVVILEEEELAVLPASSIIEQDDPELDRVVAESKAIFNSGHSLEMQVMLLEKRAGELNIITKVTLLELGMDHEIARERELFTVAGYNNMASWWTIGIGISPDIIRHAVAFYRAVPFLRLLDFGVNEILTRDITYEKAKRVFHDGKDFNRQAVAAKQEIAQMRAEVDRIPVQQVEKIHQLEERIRTVEEELAEKTEEKRDHMENILRQTDQALIDERKAKSGAPAEVRYFIEGTLYVDGHFEGRITIEQLTPELVAHLGKSPYKPGWKLTGSDGVKYTTEMVEYMRDQGNLIPSDI